MRKRIPLEDLQVSDVKKERMTELQEAYHHEFRLAMPDGWVVIRFRNIGMSGESPVIIVFESAAIIQAVFVPYPAFEDR